MVELSSHVSILDNSFRQLHINTSHLTDSRVIGIMKLNDNFEQLFATNAEHLLQSQEWCCTRRCVHIYDFKCSDKLLHIRNTASPTAIPRPTLTEPHPKNKSTHESVNEYECVNKQTNE
jgi:hypothetical protein